MLYLEDWRRVSCRKSHVTLSTTTWHQLQPTWTGSQLPKDPPPSAPKPVRSACSRNPERILPPTYHYRHPRHLSEMIGPKATETAAITDTWHRLRLFHYQLLSPKRQRHQIDGHWPKRRRRIVGATTDNGDVVCHLRLLISPIRQLAVMMRGRGAMQRTIRIGATKMCLPFLR